MKSVEYLYLSATIPYGMGSCKQCDPVDRWLSQP